MAKKVKKEKKVNRNKIVINKKVPKSATLLVIISAVLLIIFGLISIIFNNWVVVVFQENLGETTLTSSTLIFFGAMWIFLAYILGVVNHHILKTARKEWMVFLLILGLVIIASGRILSGLLAIVASIIYQTRTK